MKKIAILSAVLLIVGFTFQAQAGITNKGKKEPRKLEGTNVSAQAKQQFLADFGSLINVSWTRQETFDVATFDLNGKKMQAYYDSDSKLVGTTSIKTFADLPAKSQQEIKTKYKDYIIGQVIFFDDNEANETEMVLWGIEFEDADNYFVQLTKENTSILLRIDPQGSVSYFTKL